MCSARSGSISLLQHNRTVHMRHIEVCSDTYKANRNDDDAQAQARRDDAGCALRSEPAALMPSKLCYARGDERANCLCHAKGELVIETLPVLECRDKEGTGLIPRMIGFHDVRKDRPARQKEYINSGNNDDFGSFSESRIQSAVQALQPFALATQFHWSVEECTILALVLR
mmetsp:Transcript_68463/g.113816  ORF Transcript_68463/g.113816 Transcript_68463/m.113816 type:complete len:171 (-) Transcript_68463:229-741(-)